MPRSFLSGLIVALAFQGLVLVAQAPNVVTEESTVTATVDRIERSTRVVTVHADGNRMLSVYVDPSVTSFDSLQRGDVVTVRYVESRIVQVKPNAALSEPRDTTAEARQGGHPQVVEQQTAVVTILDIDPDGLSVTYRRADGTKLMRVVEDRRLLRGLKSGDRVEVTLTRERAVSIERKR